MLPIYFKPEIITCNHVIKTGLVEHIRIEDPDEYHLFFLLGGEAYIEFDGPQTNFRLYRGFLNIFGPGQRVTIKPTHKREYIHMVFKLTEGEQKPVSEYYDVVHNERMRVSDNPDIYNELMALLQEFSMRDNVLMDCLSVSRLLKVLCVLGIQFWNSEETERLGYKRLEDDDSVLSQRKLHTPGSASIRSFSKAMEFINERYKDVTLEAIANRLGVTKGTVINLFRKNTKIPSCPEGKTPKDVIYEVRMETSARMVESDPDKWSVQEIAEQVGYKPRAFKERFRDFHNKSFEQYLEEVRNKRQQEMSITGNARSYEKN